MVIAAAVPLLLVGAAFQFFDGVQVTATGALRGAGNTHAGLYVQLVGYWVVGLPLGLWLGFGRKMGAVGLWIGLAAGLMFAGVALITVWGRTVRRGVGGLRDATRLLFGAEAVIQAGMGCRVFAGDGIEIRHGIVLVHLVSRRTEDVLDIVVV